MTDTPPESETITDGYAEWAKCGPGCTMELVRIGKVQCVTLQEATEGVDPRPSTCWELL